MDKIQCEIREIQEANEKKMLSTRASFSSQSKGRFFPLSKEDCRLEYARDRDRIIHSASFRRLKDKAQVFLLSQNDMIRTRLTHTLEVSQISRTVSRALGLNEDLTEAIALGHDLGHAPFGHGGERALTELCLEWFASPIGHSLESIDYLNQGQKWTEIPLVGFRHNIQSLKIVDFLENKGQGLNLTWEVREGILFHSKWGRGLDNPDQKFLASTLEGQIVRFADRIAYVNHDLQDGLRSRMIHVKDIPKEYFEILGDTHSERIGKAVVSIIRYFHNTGTIGLESDILKAIDGLYQELSRLMYKSEEMEEEMEKASFIIHQLAYFYRANPHVIEAKVADIPYAPQVSLEQKIIDHLANMTDHYILREFHSLRMPKGWAGH